MDGNSCSNRLRLALMNNVINSLAESSPMSVWITVYAVLVVRYVLVAGLAFSVWYGWRRRKILHRKIQQRFPRRSDYAREIAYSLVTFAVFSAVAVVVFASPLKQYTQIYGEVAEFGWGYFFLSITLMIVVHDAYFYWAHRLMHHPKIYRHVHLVHHKSTNPSPWAAFAFHPAEAVVEAGIIVFVAFIIPAHPGAIMTFLLFMTLYNVYGHLGWEVYPQGADRRGLTKWMNTSVSHNMHHRFVTANYGLYFMWWDKLFGTVHDDYHRTFAQVTGKLDSALQSSTQG